MIKYIQAIGVNDDYIPAGECMMMSNWCRRLTFDEESVRKFKGFWVAISSVDENGDERPLKLAQPHERDIVLEHMRLCEDAEVCERHGVLSEKIGRVMQRRLALVLHNHVHGVGDSKAGQLLLL
jgi:hypothetical protein